MKNKENFLKLVTKEKASSIKKIQVRIKNREMLIESKRIAVKVLLKLDELGWTQKMLADEMGVTPQYISKIVKGRENSNIFTLTKLQNILGISIFASLNENNKNLEDETSSYAHKASSHSSIVLKLELPLPRNKKHGMHFSMSNNSNFGSNSNTYQN